MTNLRSLSFLAAAVAAFAAQASVQAASIGLKFAAEQWADTYTTDGSGGGYNNYGGASATIADSAVAGYVPQTHWNNFSNGSGAAGPVSLTQSDGTAAPGMGVTWSGGGWTYHYNWTDGFYGTLGNGDTALHAGYIDGGSTITVTGIPYSSYNVIVYTGSDGGGRLASAHLATSSPTGAVDGSTYYSYTFWSSGNYVQATATTSDTAFNANYALFTGNTADSFTLTESPIGGNSGVFGIQIVAVPEPMSLSLMGMGATGLLLRRRRA